MFFNSIYVVFLMLYMNVFNYLGIKWLCVCKLLENIGFFIIDICSFFF